MKRFYWLLIFHIAEIETHLFERAIERDTYINETDPESYRLFQYEIDSDYEDVDIQHTEWYFTK